MKSLSPCLVLSKRKFGDDKIRLDGGCGNGRVSKKLLSKLFDQIDLVDPVQHLLNKAKKEIGSALNTAFCCGLHQFFPEKKYLR